MRLWNLHKQGYRLCDNAGSLSAIQGDFLSFASAVEAELTERESKRGGSAQDYSDPKAIRERLRKKVEEKRRGNSGTAHH